MPAEDERLHVDVMSSPIDITSLSEWVADPGAGAVLCFVGVVRHEKQGRRVLRIDYEAYAPMARRVLLRIGRDMLRMWPARRAALVHRVGRLEIGEASIAIVVSTPHRAAGFEALRHGIEAVKRDLPVWKKEHFEDGEVWAQEGA